ncbi:caspase a-like [Salminus brasiliensis]|uniref:caspase a-like n=1 Tax=Salminus brasiliensis TaxID=930266 RepID=UPI003B8345A4
MSKSVWDILLEALEDLDSEQFKKFTAKLTDSGLQPRVRRGAVEGKDRGDVARLLIETYTEKRALEITVQLLRTIGANQIAEDLEQEAAANGYSQSAGAGGSASAATPGGAGSAATPANDASKAAFIDEKSADLVQRATGVESILDVLLCRKVINNEQYSEISAEKTAQKMMRCLISEALRASGNLGKAALYQVLMDQQPYMMQDLGLPLQSVLAMLALILILSTLDLTPALTFRHHSELHRPLDDDLVFSQGEEKRALEHTLVRSRVVERDIMDEDGSDLNICRSLRPLPLQTLLKVIVHDGGERVFIMEDLQEREREKKRGPNCGPEGTMSKSVRDILLEALEDLDSEQFKKFTAKLTDSGLQPRVRRGAVEGKDRGDVARLLIETYTEKRALEITAQLLRTIGANQIAEDLEQEAADFVRQAPQPEPPLQSDVTTDPEIPSAGDSPTLPPNPNSALIHCTPQFKENVLREKGKEIYHVLDKGTRKCLALLINNVEFDNANLRRNGAQIDEENMETLLRGLGYDVVKHTNLSGREMDEAIRSFAGRSEHAESDSTFVVIMSHGKKDKILGVHHGPDNDKDFLPVDNIYTHLNTANCPALRDKPKVILIQACRGDRHGRVWVSDSESDDMEIDGVWEHKEKDFVSLFSCTPDTVSFRNEENGAYFIGFLVEVFNANAHKDHIEELFRQVMRRFENFRRFRQMVSKDRISLTKLFYLFPGL